MHFKRILLEMVRRSNLQKLAQSRLCSFLWVFSHDAFWQFSTLCTKRPVNLKVIFNLYQLPPSRLLPRCGAGLRALLPTAQLARSWAWPAGRTASNLVATQCEKRHPEKVTFSDAHFFRDRSTDLLMSEVFQRVYSWRYNIDGNNKNVKSSPTLGRLLKKRVVKSTKKNPLVDKISWWQGLGYKTPEQLFYFESRILLVF